MAEWWKNLSEVFARPSDETAGRERTVTLKERLDHEKEKLREQEVRSAAILSSGGTPQSANRAVTAEADLQEDLRALRSLLGWKLGVQVNDLAGNPSKVDGYWFGVRRYLTQKPILEADKDGTYYETCWTLHFFRQCPHCRFLFPTLELGDYREALNAAKNMMAGKEADVSRSTEKLAAYLNTIEAGRPDEHCPRQCPSCRKLLRGGTK